ncbi:26S proteasome regulatory subunit S5A [Encephalitozoon intestinalis ATCC 50506]|uniref:26S proteasome regulatory subunit S5A n=1 Tax=Encephalitozoon intestinalis (strain ATCC 50506) TaxID=876142 RepID=E0S9H8_ENCIT|nr:26S proteasome regulatory subunit S5A [Encephalitozoon intestinalis ATCC 50506]ADM12363.1 26S proteasome regulatory subunit S5A [Encephalitozoon intestinalis ATCC 50506]UTX46195.1 regulatory subunit RPN10 [Encephalitozoon intestinalis]
MPETIVVLFDNGMASQNQDYLPSRFIVQKETVESLISRKFEDNQENTIGIIPLVQVQSNDIITPTKQRSHIKTFLNDIKLNKEGDIMRCLSQSLHIFNQRDSPGCILVVFLASELQESEKDELFARIYQLLTFGIGIKMVFFGEAVEMVEAFKKIDFTNFSCIEVKTNEEFIDRVLPFISGNDLVEEDDPELAEAIRLSLEEQKKQQK